MRDLDDVQRRLKRVEALVETVQRSADPSVRAATQELIEAILDLHGAGLDRILEIVTGVAQNGDATLDRFCRDELVASLLMLHGLHPVDFDTRVRKAVATLEPALRSQGGSIELLSIEDGVVRLRLTRNGHGCSGAAALQQTIRSAFYESAPDLQRLEIDEVSEPAPVAVVPLSSLRRNTVGAGPIAYSQERITRHG